MTEQRTENSCPSCKSEPEPGWIEMPNNGPIVPCWLCNRERWLDDQRYVLIAEGKAKDATE